jgi:hypothetical protein
MDPVQRRLPVSVLSRLRHSVSIQSTEDKLRWMLADFDFAPAAEVLAEVGLLPSETR